MKLEKRPDGRYTLFGYNEREFVLGQTEIDELARICGAAKTVPSQENQILQWIARGGWCDNDGQGCNYQELVEKFVVNPGAAIQEIAEIDEWFAEQLKLWNAGAENG